MNDASPAWEVHDLHKTYRTEAGGSVEAARGISFQVPAGQIFGLLGPNGAGKSTTIRCTLGLSQPDTGSCQLFGQPGTSHAARACTGYAPDSLRFPAGVTGAGWLREMGRLSGLSPKQIEERLPPLAERVGLQVAIHRPVRGYSRGMTQRLLWLQAVLHQPKILFFDEPTAGLDPVGVRDFGQWMRTLQAAGTTIILCTHHLEQVASLCDAVVILVDGQIAYRGTVAKLAAQTQPDSPLQMQITPSLATDPAWEASWRTLAQTYDLPEKWTPTAPDLHAGYRKAVSQVRQA